ncbi:MAG: non-homologous end-joining DNA ligase [Candidatus Eremiobacterota bacterium]
MLPVASQRVPADEERWAYEIKFDGFRALVFCTGGEGRVQSRSLRDMTPFYPELVPLGRQLRGAVLDGEIVAFNSEGKPDFERMQARAGFYPELGRRRFPSEPFPVCYQIFDLLYLDGQSLMGLSYAERRARLEELGLSGPAWMVPSNSPGPGNALLQASRDQGLEGLVAKRRDSPYLPGQRSDHWLKIKNWRRQEFVVAGWRRDAEGAEGWLGSLLVGYFDQGLLRYAGGVEAGFARASLEVLRELIPRLECGEWAFTDRPRKRDETPLEPVLVCEVQFLDWSTQGHIRHTAFKGFVVDKDPRSVIREPG